MTIPYYSNFLLNTMMIVQNYKNNFNAYYIAPSTKSCRELCCSPNAAKKKPFLQLQKKAAPKRPFVQPMTIVEVLGGGLSTTLAHQYQHSHLLIMLDR